MRSALRISANNPGCGQWTDHSLDPCKATHPPVTIGQTVPRIGLTALVRGRFTYLDHKALADRWMALCFLSSPTASSMTYVNAQAEAFSREGAALLVVLSDISLLQLAQYEDLRPFTVPLLTDSLNRMHRSYGVALNPASATAVTFLIDPLRVLRFHIAHDLTLWNLDDLHGLLRAKRHRVSDPAQWVTVDSARALVSVGDANHTMVVRREAE